MKIKYIPVSEVHIFGADEQRLPFDLIFYGVPLDELFMQHGQALINRALKRHKLKGCFAIPMVQLKPPLR
jgi:hypothetical protein